MRVLSYSLKPHIHVRVGGFVPAQTELNHLKGGILEHQPL